MRVKYRKSKVFLVIATLTVAGLLWFGTQITLNWALKREAGLIGMDWAHHIEKQLSHLSQRKPLNGSPDKAYQPTTEELRSLLVGVFSIGHIFQFDYINTACHCHVSLIAEQNSAGPVDPHSGHEGHGGHEDQGGHEGHQDHASAADHAGHDSGAMSEPKPQQQDSHQHGSQTTASGSLPNRLWNHVVHSQKPHANPKTNKSDGGHYPVNFDLVDQIVQSQNHGIVIRQDNPPYLPSVLAVVYHPVLEGDEVSYVLRVLVDLEDQELVYKQLLFIAALSGAALIGFLVGYPTWRYMSVVKRKRRADKRVAFLANHDVLTNLYNRNNFQETVSDIIWTAHEQQKSALLFVFDLNDFKEVNDFYGHPVGDRVLCEFASVLRNMVPENGYIARLGGDEFVVVISGIEGKDFEFRDFLDIPKEISIKINGGAQTVSTSIAGGVVRYPRDAESVEELIQLADLALYAAKPERSGAVCEYEPRLKSEFFDRLNIRDEFREALNTSQVEPFYQPIVNMHTGLVEGFEGLARWNHPERGILTPFVFADVLEDGSISAQLGQLMFEKIADEMAYWQSLSVPFIKVALNVTDGDLKSRSFADDILQGLKSRGLRSSNLTIEVTENCLFGSDKGQSIGHLNKLRAAGCAIALDDFGTGYSSITQLKELPITTIKIDKSFIDDVLENHDDQSIISAMLELGKSMNFNLVMEGIETASQLALLKRMGSELAQGYYFARPMPAAEVPAYVERQNARYDEAAVQRRSA